MLSSVDLFSLTLLATGGLYACMLAYFGGLIGTKRRHTRIVWNSEPIAWIITLLLTFTVAYRVVEPAAEGPGMWYLIGTGNLLVIYIYLIVELARHDLPAAGYWSIAALTAAALIYVTASIVMAILSQTLDLEVYRDVLAMLLAAMTHLLMLVLLVNLARSLHRSMLKTWMANPNSPDRLKAGGIAVTAEGEVGNPDGALSVIGSEAATPSAPALLQPGASITVDFGLRRIEDHGFRSDLRINCSNSEHALSVEVSNDQLNWVACEIENKVPTDWDVPFFASPWRYVRIRNAGEQAVEITDVYDLD